MVEEWFSGTMFRAAAPPVPGRSRLDDRPQAIHKMREDDPYFGYIANNIRLSER